uniref:Uncharacterized protein n=1 Tax=Nelumbo nucifera TaxID=4432 RepID=A0A822YXR7_NELNU|nr:TPA_asm: hypothetical protein HUJ06_008113 [Nelumbo nucifera]
MQVHLCEEGERELILDSAWYITLYGLNFLEILVTAWTAEITQQSVLITEYIWVSESHSGSKGKNVETIIYFRLLIKVAGGCRSKAPVGLTYLIHA